MGTPERLTLAERCRGVELLVLDVDGVLTAGGIVHGSGGLELKQFHVRDGGALRWWRESGKRAALLTGRRSEAVTIRAKELGIAFVMQGADDKLTAYRQLLADAGVAAGQTACLGDDLPDLPVLRQCGLALTPADACPEARAAAHYVCSATGGQGAVRESVERILRCQGAWRQTVERVLRN